VGGKREEELSCAGGNIKVFVFAFKGQKVPIDEWLGIAGPESFVVGALVLEAEDVHSKYLIMIYRLQL
jgi:hypothetical protein